MWIQVAIWFATMLLGELLFSGGAPKPQTNTDQLEFPDTRQDRKIPLFAGTVQQKGPLLAWWGDVRKVAMTKSVKTGLFSEEDTIVGYKYYVAVQIVIGHGPIDAVTAVHVGRKEAWTGSTVDGPISGDQPNLFGPSDGEGGISGTLWVHGGALNQAPDSYAEMKLERRTRVQRDRLWNLDQHGARRRGLPRQQQIPTRGLDHRPAPAETARKRQARHRRTRQPGRVPL